MLEISVNSEDRFSINDTIVSSMKQSRLVFKSSSDRSQMGRQRFNGTLYTESLEKIPHLFEDV